MASYTMPHALNHVSPMKGILFLLLCTFPLLAQEEGMPFDTIYVSDIEAVSYEADEIEPPKPERAPYTAPPLKPLNSPEVPPEKWDEASKNLDYSNDRPRPRKERQPRENTPSDVDWIGGFGSGLGILLQGLAVLFALGVIAYGIYWMMQMPRNKTLARDGTEITLANLDEYIHETDLERYLREALAAANWPLALRLYFLQTIKMLSESGAITWSREKTNRDYLREMRGNPLGTHFRNATRHYERVWYGNQPLTAEEFAELEPDFKVLLGEN